MFEEVVVDVGEGAVREGELFLDGGDLIAAGAELAAIRNVVSIEVKPR